MHLLHLIDDVIIFYIGLLISYIRTNNRLRHMTNYLTTYKTSQIPSFNNKSQSNIPHSPYFSITPSKLSNLPVLPSSI